MKKARIASNTPATRCLFEPRKAAAPPQTTTSAYSSTHTHRTFNAKRSRQLPTMKRIRATLSCIERLDDGVSQAYFLFGFEPSAGDGFSFIDPGLSFIRRSVGFATGLHDSDVVLSVQWLMEETRNTGFHFPAHSPTCPPAHLLTCPSTPDISLEFAPPRRDTHWVSIQ